MISGRIIIVMALGLTACGMQPEPAPPVLMTPETYASRSLGDAGLKDFLGQHGSAVQAEWPKKQWNVKELTLAALYYNPAMAVAQSQIEVAKAAELTAGQSPNPVLGISPSYDNSVSPREWLLGVSLSIPIETNGKKEIREALSRQQTYSVIAQARTAAWDARHTLLLALIDAYAAEQNLQAQQHLLQTQQQIVALYAARSAQGQLPSAVASQASVAYRQTQLQLEQSRTAKDNADARIAQAVGVPVGALEGVRISYDELLKNEKAPLDLSALTAQALPKHPALVAAMMDYEAAHQALRLELAKQVPDIDLGPGYEWNSQGGGKFTLGLSFTLPLMNDNEGPIAEAAAKRALSAKQFDAAQAGVISTAEQAYMTLQGSEKSMALVRTQITEQQQNYSRLQSRIHGQEIGQLPLLYAEAEVQVSEIAVLNTRIQHLQALAALEDALRIPLVGPGFMEEAH